jgi:hypothetical protein
MPVILPTAARSAWLVLIFAAIRSFLLARWDFELENECSSSDVRQRQVLRSWKWDALQVLFCRIRMPWFRGPIPDDLREFIALCRAGRLSAVQEWIEAGKRFRNPEGNFTT